MGDRMDSLTGLMTGQALEQRLKQGIKEEEAVALAALDVDHFMEINEQLGLDKGDHVLKTVAQLLLEGAGDGLVYRISGDEFAVLYVGGSLEQSFLKMEQLRIAIQNAAERFDLPASFPNPISVTIGVAQYPRDAKDDQSLMRSANAAMMAAKEAGRNQVSLPPNEEMIMKSCYYPATLVRRLKVLSDKTNKKESVLLREALADYVRKLDRLEG